MTHRSAIAVLAGAGAIETSIITADKLVPQLGGAAVALCSAAGGGCSDVLNGPWSSVSGIPLAAVGAVAYTGVAALASLPRGGETAETDSRDMALLAACAAMAGFSACLMLLLVQLQQPCALCIGSALLSASMLVLAWRAELGIPRTEAAVLVACGAALSVAAGGALYSLKTSELRGAELQAVVPARAPPIRSRSSPRAEQIGARLAEHDARMFGAFWCSHCINQKETLGKEAFGRLEYVECDAQAADTQKLRCNAEGIRGYPTWQVDGELFPGEKSLEELEELLQSLPAKGATPR